jgi:hypothetical protein
VTPNLEQRVPREGASKGTEIRLLYTLPEGLTCEQEDKSHRAKRLGFGASAEMSLDRVVNLLSIDSTAISAMRQYYPTKRTA